MIPKIILKILTLIITLNLILCCHHLLQIMNFEEVQKLNEANHFYLFIFTKCSFFQIVLV